MGEKKGTARTSVRSRLAARHRPLALTSMTHRRTSGCTLRSLASRIALYSSISFLASACAWRMSFLRSAGRERWWGWVQRGERQLGERGEETESESEVNSPSRAELTMLEASSSACLSAAISPPRFAISALRNQRDDARRCAFGGRRRDDPSRPRGWAGREESPAVETMGMQLTRHSLVRPPHPSIPLPFPTALLQAR
jgi:hypothetical protein